MTSWWLCRSKIFINAGSSFLGLSILVISVCFLLLLVYATFCTYANAGWYHWKKYRAESFSLTAPLKISSSYICNSKTIHMYTFKRYRRMTGSLARQNVYPFASEYWEKRSEKLQLCWKGPIWDAIDLPCYLPCLLSESVSPSLKHKKMFSLKAQILSIQVTEYVWWSKNVGRKKGVCFKAAKRLLLYCKHEGEIFKLLTNSLTV